MEIGKLRLVINPIGESVWTQQGNLISVREENNETDVTFSYDKMFAASLTAGQVLYEEGVVGDTSQTYIKVYSEDDQTVNPNTTGIIILKVQSYGVSNQLDKEIPFSIGTNNVKVNINFESRPNTLLLSKSVANYTIPIQITKEDVLANVSDFDNTPIIEVAINTNGENNFRYNGSTYTSMLYVPLNTLNSLGLYYYPDNNSLGYTKEYDWYVKDSTGLTTKI